MLTQQRLRGLGLVSMKISGIIFFKNNCLFYQPLPFYGKSLKPPFWKKFENSNPLFIKENSNYEDLQSNFKYKDVPAS